MRRRLTIARDGDACDELESRLYMRFDANRARKRRNPFSQSARRQETSTNKAIETWGAKCSRPGEAIRCQNEVCLPNVLRESLICHQRRFNVLCEWVQAPDRIQTRAEAHLDKPRGIQSGSKAQLGSTLGSR